MNLDFISILALFAFSLPLLGFVVLNAWGKKLFGGGDWIATTIMGICTLLSSYIFYDCWVLEHVNHSNFAWAASFNMGMLIDRESSLMMLIITFVSLLVTIFSTTYMKGDQHYSRYFSYLQLFSFSMLGLVLVNNLIGIYLFWELVGLSSYLLIGFWQHKPTANRASKKAFLLNRIGDAGFLIGIGAIFALYQKLGITELQQVAVISSDSYLHWIAGFGLLCGAIGKSAQFPLSIWLPDAMEGPTPVSALIHAATMVAAGVYLLVRFSFLLTADVQLLAALIGSITAFMAAFSALSQTDIKKVLAYSTVSQLGYMIMAIGVGAPALALFHLLTHAFFKACLFLSSGSVIHSLHEAGHITHHDFDAQDMRLMGGLRRKLPVTFWAFIISGCSLAGLPFFSGFLSKDAILIAMADQASTQGGILYLCLALGLIGAFFTAFYVGRMLWNVFFGELRNPEIQVHIKESGWAVKAPIALLAILSTWLIFSLNPLNGSQSWALPLHTDESSNLHLIIELLSISIAIGGLLIAYLIYGKAQFSGIKKVFSEGSFLHKLSFNFWFMDVLYMKTVKIVAISFTKFLALFDKQWVDGLVHLFSISSVVVGHILAWADRNIIDGTVHVVTGLANRTGSATRSIQGGKIQLYFIWGMIGLLALVYFFIF